MITVRVTQTDDKETVFIVDNPELIQFNGKQVSISSMQNGNWTYDKFYNSMWKKIEVTNDLSDSRDRETR